MAEASAFWWDDGAPEAVLSVMEAWHEAAPAMSVPDFKRAPDWRLHGELARDPDMWFEVADLLVFWCTSRGVDPSAICDLSWAVECVREDGPAGSCPYGRYEIGRLMRQVGTVVANAVLQLSGGEGGGGQNPDRDEWIVAQKEAGKSHKQIISELHAIHRKKDWDTIHSPQGISMAIKRERKRQAAK